MLRRSVVAALTASVLMSACTGGRGGGTKPSPPPRAPGGTLRVGLMSGDQAISGWCPFLMCGRTFDPQSTSFVDVFELDRCCFLRTLLTYTGASVADGGTELKPDMALALPTISADGLAWTFRLRAGVHYAPPMARTEIVAGDFIRSYERAFTKAGPAVPWANGGTIGGYWTSTYLEDVIAGVPEFTQGKADHVSGLEAPDRHTLVVHLTRPVGDLGYRLALSELGPLPANPARPGDPQGVAQGHDFDYGNVMVSSGPYMFEGSEKLAYDLPPENQLPAAGNGFDRAVLVRNPSWSRQVDGVREAWADRIEFTLVASPEEAERKLVEDSIDVVLNWAADAATTSRWLADPKLRGRTTLAPADGMLFLALNLALPPFDDLHVRRAMYLAVDRRAAAAAMEDTHAGFTQQVFTHLGLDAYEDNLLLSYSPPGVGEAPNLAAARDEMAQSRYDSDHDGLCDAPSCSDQVLTVRASDRSRVQAAGLIADQLRGIGLDLTLEKLDDDSYFDIFDDPKAHVAIQIGAWFKDFPSASTFFPVLLHGGTRVTASLVGATPAQLRKYGYSVRSVPSVDGQLDACETLVFEAQLRCWARLDQYLSEQLVPWIPLTQQANGWLVSSRVDGLNVDASIGIPVPALDNIRSKPEAEPSPSVSFPLASPHPAIPDGVYRMTLTLQDIVGFGGPADDTEDTGTFTIVIKGGHFFWHQRADVPVFNPISLGRYVGSGARVRFEVDQPYYNAAPLSSLSWRMNGEALVFTLPKCTGPAAADQFFCGVQKALFTAHPWERVPEVSGGWI